MAADNQIGFIDVLAVPMFQAFINVFPGCRKLREQLDTISKFWRTSAGSSSNLQNSTLQMLQEELVSLMSERYENIVGTTFAGMELEVDESMTFLMARTAAPRQEEIME